MIGWELVIPVPGLRPQGAARDGQVMIGRLIIGIVATDSGHTCHLGTSKATLLDTLEQPGIQKGTKDAYSYMVGCEPW